LAFVAHLLLNAEAFAAAYNEALAAYRSRCGIRGRQRPMPDLAAAGERIELPFWLLHDSRPRERLSVSPVGGDGVRLWSGAEAICTLSRRELRANADEVVPQCLNGWEIRPRALALMMYARLFVCDLFIHGVGGAKYDQITDAIIRRFFEVEPPAYGCVSATLRLPLRVYEVTEADHQSCRQRLRDMPFNPQRHLSAPAPPQITRLLGERSRAIAESQRLRRQTPRDHGARREAFERLHRANEAVVAASPDLMERARGDLAAIRAQLGHNRTALSREWFFALYPVEKLGALREALQIDD
jgi:hypothetical protein